MRLDTVKRCQINSHVIFVWFQNLSHEITWFRMQISSLNVIFLSPRAHEIRMCFRSSEKGILHGAWSNF